MFDDSSEDVVPTDIIAGLILLRRLQTLRRDIILSQDTNDTYHFLSGVGITPSTQFVDINDPLEVIQIREYIHFIQYCMASYGWPVAAMASQNYYSNESEYEAQECLFGSCCSRTQTAKCCPASTFSSQESQAQRTQVNNTHTSQPNYRTRTSNVHDRWSSITVGDNICRCNERAFQKLSTSIDCELVYAKYNARVGEPSFSVLVDHDKRCVVVCIRGTFCLEDLITDLNAESEVLPLNPLQPTWTGHQGMVFAAEYVKRELFCRELLKRAFSHRIERGTNSYRLILVGHSMGAGVACILSVLLRPLHPDLHCYAFAPPGGLLSAPVVEYSRCFISTIILGKDLFPRLSLCSAQALRRDVLAAISSSTRPKWKIIGYSCCFPSTSLRTGWFGKKSQGIRKNRKVTKMVGGRKCDQSSSFQGNNTSVNNKNNRIEKCVGQEREADQMIEDVVDQSEADVTQESEQQKEMPLDSEEQEMREAVQFWKQRMVIPFSSVAASGQVEDASVSLLHEQTQQCQQREVKLSVESRPSGQRHEQLLPPGNIIHIVRSHPKRNGCNSNSSVSNSKTDVVFQAIRVKNTDLDEVLICPGMIRDHLPFNILPALHGLLTQSAPPKPGRLASLIDPSPYDDNANQSASMYRTHRIRRPNVPPPLPPSIPPPPIPQPKAITDQPHSYASKMHHVYASIDATSSSYNINNIVRPQQQLSASIEANQGPSPTPTDTVIDGLSVSSKLLIETSFTDLRPCSASTDTSTCYYTSGGSYGRRSLMNGFNYYSKDGATTIRTRNTSRPSFLSALRHHRKHDLFRHDWMRPAPLASPENSILTDTSSLLSRNHEGCHTQTFKEEHTQDNESIQDQRRKSEGCYYEKRHDMGTKTANSRLSLQDLIDVFSDCSDTRSLEDMVEEAKRVVTPVSQV